jgi:CheY-like chemotaxis protein
MIVNNHLKRSGPVLLVEDNVAHAELIMAAASAIVPRPQMIHLIDGEAALEYIAAAQEPNGSEERLPSLVLLDLQLPKIDGLEVLQRLKGSPDTRWIPVVILTTSEAESDLRRAYDQHANGYLVKPTTFAEFSNMMRAMGDYWLGYNCQP